MHFYGSIQKVDKEQRMVWGYASTEATDAHGETVLKSAVEGALDDYLEYANLREMHQLSAVGTTQEASVDDKGLYIGAKVVDDTAWKKITEGVYKGFSIGGKVLARDSKNKKTITKIRLDEISLVDRPSNPESRFDVWKAAGAPQEDAMAKKSKPPVAEEMTESAQLPLVADAGAVAADPVEKAAGAASSGAVEGEDQLEKTGGAQDVTAEAATEANPDDLTKGEGETPAAAETVEEKPADPVAKATAALQAADEKLAAIAVGDTKKGMYAVGRFAEVLESIAYLAQSAEYEAEMEADGSPVPAKLRDWIKAGAAIFKDMAREEVDELVAAGKVKKATAAEPISVDVSVVGADALAKAIDEAKSQITAERDTLAKSLAERDEQLTKLADHVTTTLGTMNSTIDALTKRNDGLQAEIAEIKTAIDGALAKGIAEGLEKYGNAPAPAKTASVFAVSKEQDATGNASLEKSEPSNEDIQKALAELPPEERALLLTKAALLMPRQAHFVTAR
jgi:phage head maturation protease